MKIESVSVASPVTIKFKREDIQAGIYKYPVEVEVLIGQTGLKNDTHTGVIEVWVKD